MAGALLAKSTRLTGDLLSLLKGPRKISAGDRALRVSLLRQRYRVFGLVACVPFESAALTKTESRGHSKVGNIKLNERGNVTIARRVHQSDRGSD